MHLTILFVMQLSKYVMYTAGSAGLCDTNNKDALALACCIVIKCYKICSFLMVSFLGLCLPKARENIEYSVLWCANTFIQSACKSTENLSNSRVELIVNDNKC